MKLMNNSAFYTLSRIEQMKEACFDLRLLLKLRISQKRTRLSALFIS